jgi:hypothetical protein
VWSADEVADDWHRGITASDIVRLAIRRIEAKGHRGVLLLHDIHPATANALPVLLKELKARGYRIVQAVPTGERPQSVPERPAPQVAESGGWPRVLKISATDESTAKAVKSRHRKALADNDPAVSASIAKKKRRAQTAAAETGWFLFWR